MALDEHVAWFDDYSTEDSGFQVEEYDITAAPNDFNILTIFNFLESGAVRIHGFQRNYVWDRGRASKLIELLILGLSVPQVFLYEVDRNSFVVIDGQQRLLSIYYFVKQRFPLKEKRSELRTIFDQNGRIPDEVIHDDRYFENFRLKLSDANPSRRNKFRELSYATLSFHKTPFELRAIRNVIIKQNAPQDDDSSMYEVFNCLNTGGINLKPQEIRGSMYHSEFYDMLYRANSRPEWRHILNNQEPDLHMKDVEIILRGFALLMDGQTYSPSMVRFLNEFSRKCRKLNKEQIKYLFDLHAAFARNCAELPSVAFLNKRSGRFNVALYEATFAAVCERALEGSDLGVLPVISNDALNALDADVEFQGALLEGTTQTKNVKLRIHRAKAILLQC